VEFRQQFGEEMALVFADANADAARAGLASQIHFAVHEVGGILCGALGEHIRSVSGLHSISRRIAMISKGTRFRFPVAAIALMAFSFAGIVFAIHNARAIAFSLAGSTYMRHGVLYTYRPEGLSFLQTFGFAFAVTLVCAVAAWAVLHTLHRSGVHRLAEAQTWPQQ
jgi:hypothetical protein